MSDKNSLADRLFDLVDRLFDRGAIEFGAFRLKLHENNPGAPLSPVRLNFRKPPDGPLTDEDVVAIGQELFDMIKDEGVKFDLIAGIPRAGESFAKVISRLSGKPLLKLGKKEEGGTRKINSVVDGGEKAFIGDSVLLIDDLITQYSRWTSSSDFFYPQLLLDLGLILG